MNLLDLLIRNLFFRKSRHYALRSIGPQGVPVELYIDTALVLGYLLTVMRRNI